MNWGCLIAGFILLFNPVIHVVDVIPDAIGFFLIAAGLTKSSYYIGEISKARDMLVKLAFLECVKFFSIVFIPYTSGSTKVLLAFVFGIAELLLFIPSINALFEGIYFMGMCYGGDAIYRKKVKTVKLRNNEKKTKQIELINSTKKFILSFYIVRVAATLIPELTELQMYDNIGEVKALQFRLTYYKPFLYIVCSLTVLVLGAIYIYKIADYFGAIKRDRILNEALKNKYVYDILPQTNLFTAKNMKIALFMFILSVICEFVFPIDGVNVIVGVISASLLLTSSAIVKKYIKSAVVIIPLAIIRAALAVVNMVLQIQYFGEYSVEAIDYITTAHDKYYLMSTFIAVEKIVALAAVLVFFTVLLKAIKIHLDGFGVKTEIESTQYSKKNRDLETYNIIGGKLLLCSVLAIINYIFAASHAYLAVNMTAATLITSVVTLIYIAYIIYTVNLINELVYDKELELI